MNSMKSLIVDLTKVLLLKSLIVIYCLIVTVMHYQILSYRIEIELLSF